LRFGRVGRTVEHDAAIYAATGFIDALGNGLLSPLVILYLTRVLHFDPFKAGFSLAVGAAAGIAATPIAGAVLDRIDPRRVTAVCFLAAAVGYVGLGFIDSLALLVVVMAFIQSAEHAAKPAINLIAFALRDGSARLKLLAQQRSVRNLGYSLGALGAAGAAAIDTRPAYVAVLLLDAASYVLAAALIGRLPRGEPPPSRVKQEQSYRAVARDRPYVTLVSMASFLWLNDSLLKVGIALWVVRAVSNVSPAIVGLLFALNCILVVVLQVRISRGSETVHGVGRLFLLAGIALAVSCGFFASANAAPTVLATAALIAGVTILTIGEMSLLAAEFGSAAALAPPQLRGRYLALLSVGHALQHTVGPVVVTLAVVSGGRAGWLVFGVCFLALGAAANRVACKADKTRLAG
jgi:hypothetical protein